MSKLILNPEFKLYEKDGKPFCDSLQTAEAFEKRHSDVLRDIEKSIDSILKIGERKFAETNFFKDSYRDSQNKKQPKYLLTKNGFTKIAFGYEGERATKFQIDYINRFNQMEAFIMSLSATKIEFPYFTDAIMAAHEEPKHYHFSNEINMIYRIALSMDAKAFREAHGLEKNAAIKPYMTLSQIKVVEELQRVDIGLFEAGLDYEQRKDVLQRCFEKIRLRITA